jgi:hypothetical protein
VRSRRHVSLVALALGVIGTFFGALALSAVFAHPAGASTLPGPSGAPSVGAVSNTARPAAAAPVVAAPAVAVLPDVVDTASAAAGSDPTTGSNAMASPVVTLLRVPSSALRGLTSVIEPISKTIASLLGPVVTTLPPVTTAVTGTALPLVQPTARSQARAVPKATTTLPVRAATGAPGSPLPAPAWPFQSFPLVTSSSPAGDASSSSGGNGLAGAPASGLRSDPRTERDPTASLRFEDLASWLAVLFEPQRPDVARTRQQQPVKNRKENNNAYLL